MKCPYCGSDCQEGIAESRHTRFMQSFFINTLWYPKEEEGKLLKDHLHSMPRKTAAWYCENCRKVFAEYDVYPKRKN